MTRTTKRSTRLIELHEFLMARHRPVSMKELTQHFEMGRHTLRRMLSDLEREQGLVFMPRGDRLYEVDRTRSLNFLKLNLNEAMAVFLAVRLLARYSDKPNPHAVKALDKLSLALEKVSKEIARHISLTSDKLNRPLSDKARDYQRHLEALADGWANSTRVRLVMRKEPNLERLFDPYFIEPSAVGFVSYVIGYDHYRREERTFRIERLLHVTPTNETYTIPNTFDPLAKLAGAWGVNWGDGETPSAVALRFAAGRAAERVRETNWHETQRIEDLPDGGCVMRITVGSTQEMKPWIRQWGPDCEVLEPLELRGEIAEEMRRAGALYD
jgi:predicted DNA-binding transcriptional regulator YafY